MINPSFFHGFLLLGDTPGAPGGAVPTWTDKEMLFALGSTLAALIPVVLFIVRLAISRSREKVRKARQEIDRLKSILDCKGDSASSQDLATKETQLKELAKHLEEARQQAIQLQMENAATKNQAASHQKTADALKANLDTVQAELASYQSQLETERRRIHKALQKDGQTWTERVKHNAPDFKPLDPEIRRTPIISVLNLKGGVGKTTICANLATALDGMGYRVLLLDLDLQGSLTSLFFSESEQAQMFQEERTLADFLAASFGAEYPNLLHYTRAILPDQKSSLVPTSDYLAYAETNLTIRWLLREGNKDPRFLLRRELQLKRVTSSHDIILLDCPPLINVCCVNALTASDYLLIPVMPSKQATARAPILLRRLKEFRENINPDLKVMGILANRTHRSDLTVDEQNRLTLLRAQCKDVLGEEVPQFDRFIRQNAEFRAIEDECRPLQEGDEMHQVFGDLAREVQSRLPAFCHASGRLSNPSKEVVP